MADIFQFQSKDEEEVECPHCQIVDAHVKIALDADDEEELREILHGLYHIGMSEGYDDALRDDIVFKAEILEDKHQGKFEF